ncbi:MAG: hypothetical protein LBN08_03515 [Lactobacillales bacterium]|jgi:hypothetical protein|nr:hypothetical protein [Lactobacillales bacterium]
MNEKNLNRRFERKEIRKHNGKGMRNRAFIAVMLGILFVPYAQNLFDGASVAPTYAANDSAAKAASKTEDSTAKTEDSQAPAVETLTKEDLAFQTGEKIAFDGKDEGSIVDSITIDKIADGTGTVVANLDSEGRFVKQTFEVTKGLSVDVSYEFYANVEGEYAKVKDNNVLLKALLAETPLNVVTTLHWNNEIKATDPKKDKEDLGTYIGQRARLSTDFLLGKGQFLSEGITSLPLDVDGVETRPEAVLYNDKGELENVYTDGLSPLLTNNLYNKEQDVANFFNTESMVGKEGEDFETLTEGKSWDFLTLLYGEHTLKFANDVVDPEQLLNGNPVRYYTNVDSVKFQKYSAKEVEEFRTDSTTPVDKHQNEYVKDLLEYKGIVKDDIDLLEFPSNDIWYGMNAKDVPALKPYFEETVPTDVPDELLTNDQKGHKDSEIAKEAEELVQEEQIAQGDKASAFQVPGFNDSEIQGPERPANRLAGEAELSDVNLSGYTTIKASSNWDARAQVPWVKVSWVDDVKDSLDPLTGVSTNEYRLSHTQLGSSIPWTDITAFHGKPLKVLMIHSFDVKKSADEKLLNKGIQYWLNRNLGLVTPGTSQPLIRITPKYINTAGYNLADLDTENDESNQKLKPEDLTYTDATGKKVYYDAVIVQGRLDIVKYNDANPARDYSMTRYLDSDNYSALTKYIKTGHGLLINTMAMVPNNAVIKDGSTRFETSKNDSATGTVPPTGPVHTWADLIRQENLIPTTISGAGTPHDSLGMSAYNVDNYVKMVTKSGKNGANGIAGLKMPDSLRSGDNGVVSKYADYVDKYNYPYVLSPVLKLALSPETDHGQLPDIFAAGDPEGQVEPGNYLIGTAEQKRTNMGFAFPGAPGGEKVLTFDTAIDPQSNTYDTTAGTPGNDKTALYTQGNIAVAASFGDEQSATLLEAKAYADALYATSHATTNKHINDYLVKDNNAPNTPVLTSVYNDRLIFGATDEGLHYAFNVSDKQDTATSNGHETLAVVTSDINYYYYKFSSAPDGRDSTVLYAELDSLKASSVKLDGSAAAAGWKAVKVDLASYYDNSPRRLSIQGKEFLSATDSTQIDPAKANLTTIVNDRSGNYSPVSREQIASRDFKVTESYRTESLVALNSTAYTRSTYQPKADGTYETMDSAVKGGNPVAVTSYAAIPRAGSATVAPELKIDSVHLPDSFKDTVNAPNDLDGKATATRFSDAAFNTDNKIKKLFSGDRTNDVYQVYAISINDGEVMNLPAAAGNTTYFGDPDVQVITGAAGTKPLIKFTDIREDKHVRYFYHVVEVYNNGNTSQDNSNAANGTLFADAKKNMQLVETGDTRKIQVERVIINPTTVSNVRVETTSGSKIGIHEEGGSSAYSSNHVNAQVTGGKVTYRFDDSGVQGDSLEGASAGSYNVAGQVGSLIYYSNNPSGNHDGAGDANSYRSGRYERFRANTGTASVIFPLTTSGQIIKTKTGAPETITVWYDNVGVYTTDATQDIEKMKPLGAKLTFTNIMPARNSTVAPTTDQPARIQFSANMFSGYFYRNISSFDMSVEYFDASTTSDVIDRETGKAKTQVLSSDYGTPLELVQPDPSLLDSLANDPEMVSLYDEELVKAKYKPVMTFASLNRYTDTPSSSTAASQSAWTAGGNTGLGQVEFAGKIPLDDSGNTITKSKLGQSVTYQGTTYSSLKVNDYISMVQVGEITPRSIIDFQGGLRYHKFFAGTSESQLEFTYFSRTGTGYTSNAATQHTGNKGFFNLDSDSGTKAPPPLDSTSTLDGSTVTKGDKDPSWIKTIGGTNQTGDVTSDLWSFADGLGETTFANSSVSFKLMGTKNVFKVGGTHAHVWNSLASSSIYPDVQEAPVKTVGSYGKLLGNAVKADAETGTGNGDTSVTAFTRRYNNDLDRLWELFPKHDAQGKLVDANGAEIEEPFSEDGLNAVVYEKDVAKKVSLRFKLLKAWYHALGIEGADTPEAYDSSQMAKPGIPHGPYEYEVDSNDSYIGSTYGDATTKTKYFPTADQRYMNDSSNGEFYGNKRTSTGAGPTNAVNTFYYYVNQPMLELLYHTLVTPGKLTFEDDLPPGVEFDGEAVLWDNKGAVVTSFEDTGTFDATLRDKGDTSPTVGGYGGFGGTVDTSFKLKTIYKGDVVSKPYSDILGKDSDEGTITSESYHQRITYNMGGTVMKSLNTASMNVDPTTNPTFTLRLRVRYMGEPQYGTTGSGKAQSYNKNLKREYQMNNRASFKFDYSQVLGDDNPNAIYSRASNAVQVASRSDRFSLEFNKVSSEDANNYLEGGKFKLRSLVNNRLVNFQGQNGLDSTFATSQHAGLYIPPSKISSLFNFDDEYEWANTGEKDDDVPSSHSLLGYAIAQKGLVGMYGINYKVQPDSVDGITDAVTRYDIADSAFLTGLDVSPANLGSAEHPTYFMLTETEAPKGFVMNDKLREIDEWEDAGDEGDLADDNNIGDGGYATGAADPAYNFYRAIAADKALDISEPAGAPHYNNRDDFAAGNGNGLIFGVYRENSSIKYVDLHGNPVTANSGADGLGDKGLLKRFMVSGEVANDPLPFTLNLRKTDQAHKPLAGAVFSLETQRTDEKVIPYKAVAGMVRYRMKDVGEIHWYDNTGYGHLIPEVTEDGGSVSPGEGVPVLLDTENFDASEMWSVPVDFDTYVRALSADLVADSPYLGASIQALSEGFLTNMNTQRKASYISAKFADKQREFLRDVTHGDSSTADATVSWFIGAIQYLLSTDPTYKLTGDNAKLEWAILLNPSAKVGSDSGTVKEQKDSLQLAAGANGTAETFANRYLAATGKSGGEFTSAKIQKAIIERAGASYYTRTPTFTDPDDISDGYTAFKGLVNTANGTVFDDGANVDFTGSLTSSFSSTIRNENSTFFENNVTVAAAKAYNYADVTSTTGIIGSGKYNHANDDKRYAAAVATQVLLTHVDSAYTVKKDSISADITHLFNAENGAIATELNSWYTSSENDITDELGYNVAVKMFTDAYEAEFNNKGEPHISNFSAVVDDINSIKAANNNLNDYIDSVEAAIDDLAESADIESFGAFIAGLYPQPNDGDRVTASNTLAAYQAVKFAGISDVSTIAQAVSDIETNGTTPVNTFTKYGLTATSGFQSKDGILTSILTPLGIAGTEAVIAKNLILDVGDVYETPVTLNLDNDANQFNALTITDAIIDNYEEKSGKVFATEFTSVRNIAKALATTGETVKARMIYDGIVRHAMTQHALVEDKGGSAIRYSSLDVDVAEATGWGSPYSVAYIGTEVGDEENPELDGTFGFNTLYQYNPNDNSFNYNERINITPGDQYELKEERFPPTYAERDQIKDYIVTISDDANTITLTRSNDPSWKLEINNVLDQEGALEDGNVIADLSDIINYKTSINLAVRKFVDDKSNQNTSAVETSLKSSRAIIASENKNAEFRLSKVQPGYKGVWAMNAAGDAFVDGTDGAKASRATKIDPRYNGPLDLYAGISQATYEQNEIDDHNAVNLANLDLGDAAGTGTFYVLEETRAPKGYIKSSVRYLVDIKRAVPATNSNLDDGDFWIWPGKEADSTSAGVGQNFVTGQFVDQKDGVPVTDTTPERLNAQIMDYSYAITIYAENTVNGNIKRLGSRLALFKVGDNQNIALVDNYTNIVTKLDPGVQVLNTAGDQMVKAPSLAGETMATLAAENPKNLLNYDYEYSTSGTGRILPYVSSLGTADTIQRGEQEAKGLTPQTASDFNAQQILYFDEETNTININVPNIPMNPLPNTGWVVAELIVIGLIALAIAYLYFRNRNKGQIEIEA